MDDGMRPPPPLRGAALLAKHQRRRRSDEFQAAAADAGGGAEPEPLPPLPTPWEAYFDRRQTVACPERGATFNVYTAGESGPVVLCIHGGGYTGLSWALVAARLKGRCRVVAPDLRGHGLTASAAPGDLSLDTLAADVVAIWQRLCLDPLSPEASDPGAARGAAAAGAPTVVVGHSMGGAVATRTAALSRPGAHADGPGISQLAGLVVIDVVEGTALSSLPHMQAVLRGRPPWFDSLPAAVDWALASGMCRNRAAAHVSLPSMLTQRPAAPPGAGGAAGEAAAQQLGELGSIAEDETEAAGTAADTDDGGEPAGSSLAAAAGPPPAAEHATGSSGGGGGPFAGRWRWRTALAGSARHWEGWYRGLSRSFLDAPVPKILVLAGADRLDRELTVGQMQGRFQLVLLPQAGHAVHEDEPGRTADAISTFLRRFRVGEPPAALPRAPPGMPPSLPQVAGPPAARRPG